MEKIKSLGVIIDEGVKWKDQYNSLTGKLTSVLSSLDNLKDVLPQSKLCDVYHALFESRLRYRDVVEAVSLLPNFRHSMFPEQSPSIIERARLKD